MTLVSWILYKFLEVIGFCIYIMPFSLKKSVAKGLAFVWFYILPFRKKVCLMNLALVFPRRHEEANQAFRERCETILKQNMVHMVLMLFEIWERFYWTDETVFRRVTWHGFENLDPLLKSKKGFFFLGAHFGNWELMTRAGCAIGIPLTIITRFLRNKTWDRVWVQSRKSYGLELLNESGSGLSAIRAVQRGRALGFILDQHTGEPHGLKSRFLGLEAWCPKALALMSDRLKAPILPVFILRDPLSGHFHIYLEEIPSFPDLEDKNPNTNKMRSGSGSLNEEGIRYHIEVCNEILEKWIRRYPEQYLWMHKRFKNFVDYSQEPLPWDL
jgi:Kdo2-lipid IVA lauroyltransferase/acyltransferase